MTPSETKGAMSDFETLLQNENSQPQSAIQKPSPRPIIPQKKVDWEKPTQNYINNYGPRTMYADFKYKNMNYEQLIEARKKAFIKEQEDS